jgi:hypothetical protein
VCSLLTVTGAVLEAIGLGVVFVELAVIRSHEFGVPTPWARLRSWVRRRLLRRSHVVATSASSFATLTSSARAKVRPADLGPDASEAERIDRLERYVEHLDRDTEALPQAIDRKADEVTAKAEAADDRLRQEIEQRDEERKTALRPSLRRQAIGAACVLVGLVVGTIGQVG